MAGLMPRLLYADCEAAACGLLRELFVEVSVGTLEASSVEAVGKDGSEADDELTHAQFLNVPCHHFGFDFIPQGFGFRLGFFDQFFQFPQGFDLGCDFDSRRSVDLLCIV
jgi:hypothetical protein